MRVFFIFVLTCLLVAVAQAVSLKDNPYSEMESEFDELIDDLHPFALNVKKFTCNNLVTCQEPSKQNKRQDIPHSLDCGKKDATDYGCGFCNNTGDCNYNGVCSTEQYCICDEEHWGEFCQKTRKDKLTAFLLTLLVGPLCGLPPGAGRFYLGYTGYGVAQIILGLGIWIIIIPFSIALIIGIFNCICGGAAGAAAGGAAGAAESGIGAAAGIFGCISCFGCGTVNISLAVCIFVLGFCAELAACGWWLHDWITILTGDLEPKNGGPWGRPDRI